MVCGGGVWPVQCTGEQNLHHQCTIVQVRGGGRGRTPHSRHPPRPSQPCLSGPVTLLFALSRPLTAQPQIPALTAPYRPNLPGMAVPASHRSVVHCDLVGCLPISCRSPPHHQKKTIPPQPKKRKNSDQNRTPLGGSWRPRRRGKPSRRTTPKTGT